MKPALNQDNNPDVPLKKFPFIGKIFFGLKTGGKVYQVLLAGVGTLAIAGGVFFSLRWYESRQHKVFAATNAYQVELPEGIDKKDLQSLTDEQKEKLDIQINNALNAKVQKAELSEEDRQVVVVVLTQNGQPILPDLERKEEPSPTPTQSPSSREESTFTPTPSPTPIPLPLCTDSDGGKDYFTKGTVTTSYGDKKIDFCSDPNIVGEYSCVSGAIFAFDGFICPGPCSAGACQQVTPTPTPSRMVSPTSVLSPTVTPTPTNVPCTDTDGGKDIYTRGTVTTWGKTYEDTCYSLQAGLSLTQCSDYFCRLLEYSCQPQGYQGEGFTCQYGCKNGACLKTSPSPTITPGVPRCVDTDSQDKPNIKGTIYIDGQPKISDYCQLSWWDEQRHFWDYKFTQSCPSHSNDNYYSSTNNPSGSKADRCMFSEQKCVSPASDQYHGMTTYCSGGCNDGVCAQEAPTPTPIPTENELTFVYEGDIEQRFKNLTGRELKDDINKIYQSMKKIFGPPFRNNTVRVKPGQNNNYYNVSTNELLLKEQQFHDTLVVIGQVFYAFYDDLTYYLPDNWGSGFFNIIRPEVQIDVFTPEKKSEMRPFNDPLYELTMNSPAWASKDGKISGTFSQVYYYKLLAMTFYKLYLEDNQFFVKFNKELYRQMLDNTLQDKLSSLAAGVKPTVEGIPFNDWYDNHYLLQVKPIPGKYLIPYLEISGSEVSIIVKAVEVLSDGTKKEPSDRHSSVQIFDSNNNSRYDYSVIHYDSGGMNIGKMPTYETTPNISSDFKGALRFDIDMTNFAQISFYYPYENGKPIISGGSPLPGVFGTINRNDGYVRFKGADGLGVDSIVLDGMFQSKTTFSNYRGTVEMSFIKPGGNLPPGQTGSSPMMITKDFGDYYTTIRMVGAASSSRGAPVGPGTNCIDGWTDYENEDFGFKFKIPPEWTDNSIDEHQSETFIYRHLISTTTPEQQLDPKYKISYFEILASTSDLKNSDYSMWFENNTGNQQKMSVDFKGISAEKYVDDTKMSCASQTEEGAACDHHSEIYYFEKDDIYYLLSLGIYASPDVKDQNETNLKCFLENFELLGQEEAGLIPCPENLLRTTEQLKEQQEDWWEKPDSCDSRPEQKVCGYIRSIYDNGVIQVGSSDYRNSYCYCGFFEKNGSRVYRGTEMFSLGYKEGTCK